MSPERAVDTAPEWFSRAIAAPFTHHWIEVANCPVHFQSWEGPGTGAPGILLVHGNGAHAHWWDFIAPHLGKHHPVSAIDLSGMGDSGHREEYSPGLYADEVMAVAARHFPDDGVILVGHSFGGTVCRFAAAAHPSRVRALVLLDSSLTPRRGRRPQRETSGERARPDRPHRGPRIYPAREEAARRFRLRPPQPCQHQFILHHLAHHSVREAAGGWCWKSDHRVFQKMSGRGGTALAPPGGEPFPVGAIIGEKSRFFPPEAAEQLRTMLGAHNVVSLAGAHHHLFLEEPLDTVDAILAMLRQWGIE